MTFSVLAATATILRSRLQVARNILWRGGPARKLALITLLAMLFVTSYGLFRLSAAIVRGLQTLERTQPQLLKQIGDLERVFAAVPGVIFATALFPLLISSVGFTLGALYLARDLDVLLVTPVPMRAVFLARFVEGLLPTYFLLFVLLLPALVGFGRAVGYGWGYDLALPPILILLPLLPMSLGMLVTIALVRVLPPQRLRELMTVLGGLIGVAIYGGTQVLSGRGREIDTTTLANLLRLEQSWLPTSWAASALSAAGTGDLPDLARFGLPFLALTLGVFGLALTLAERVYYAGWAAMASTQGRRRGRPRAVPGRSLLRGPTGAILLKDLRMLPRDLQRLSQLLIPIGLSMFWIWQITVMRGNRFESPRGAVFSLLVIGLLVCTLIASNIGLPSVSREGRGYWLLQLAPIGPWPVLWAKWTLAFLPFPIVGTFFTILAGVLRHVQAGDLAYAWAALMLIGTGTSGIIVGMGAAYPRLDWTQAQRMSSVRAGCLAPIIYYSYGGLVLGLVLAPRSFGRAWGAGLIASAWGMALLLSVLALVLPLAFAAARLRRLEL